MTNVVAMGSLWGLDTQELTTISGLINAFAALFLVVIAGLSLRSSNAAARAAASASTASERSAEIAEAVAPVSLDLVLWELPSGAYLRVVNSGQTRVFVHRASLSLALFWAGGEEVFIRELQDLVPIGGRTLPDLLHPQESFSFDSPILRVDRDRPFKAFGFVEYSVGESGKHYLPSLQVQLDPER